jgi:diguanylate cyclase (GGDEF)-like protein
VQQDFDWIRAMKKWIPAAIFLPVLIFGWVTDARAAPETLTTLAAVSTAGNTRAGQRVAVAFEATVTYFRGYDHVMFVQDGDAAIFVLAPPHSKLTAGDRVLVRGTTRSSFRPFVAADNLTLLGHGAIPRAAQATFDGLIRASYDCRLVTVHGVVRSADLELITGATSRSITLQILTDGGYVEASVDSNEEHFLKELLDTTVEVTGVSAGKFDDKKQHTGALLHVSGLNSVKILKRADIRPQSLPFTPMDEIITGYHVRDLTQRIRVRGTITYSQPGSAAVVQSGDKSLWIATRSLAPLRVGDLADATGFPDVHDGALRLTRAEIEDTHVRAPITPHPTTWEQMTLRGFNVKGHVFDLVSIAGTVVTEEREASKDVYVLFSGGHMFSAIYRHSEESGLVKLPPMKAITPGSTVRLAGICIVENFNPSNNLDHDPFDILLGSVDDITVIDSPSWLTIRSLSLIVTALVLVVLSSVAWAWSLKRKVRRQTAALAVRIEAEAALERQMAHLEQRRSSILEAINGSQSLASILTQITELVTFLLDGTPCWCELRNEKSVGNRPPETTGLRIVQQEISAGASLGTLAVGLGADTLPNAKETEALSAGARLATLAVENRRLYADLVHRSEQDLLTDIPNRFSMEKKLDQLMMSARRSEALFGLIYVDLDSFKRVNDDFGHSVGDLYLQEVTRRMKLQLRSEDMLSRIGGDEFIALVPILRCGIDAEEIATRLERCFDEPFLLDGIELNGSASVGLAVYPEDGATKKDLQRSADAAMYAHKQSKRIDHDLASHSGPG